MFHTGPTTLEFGEDVQVLVRAAGPMTVLGTEDGEHFLYGAANAITPLRVTTRGDGSVRFICAEDCMFHVEHRPAPKEQEFPDPKPMEVTLEAPLTLREEMRRYIREELSAQALNQGAETFEEQDDFDCDDEADLPRSPYEFIELQDDYIGENPLPAEPLTQDSSEAQQSESNATQETAEPSPTPNDAV